MILKRQGKDPWRVIAWVADAILKAAALTRALEWSPDTLAHINQYQRCLLLVIEWLDDDEDGHHHHVLAAHPQMLTDALNWLGFDKVAGALRVTNAMKQQAFAGKSGWEAYRDASNALDEDEIYVAANAFLDESRQELILKLYDLVSRNIAHFP